ncbi:MAG: tetratricopeptide repeat protein [Deltaproteobacteria bacterium]|nr:tetratricopeptide repeat protein [Deltaproteobacteria bacterium]
MSIYAALTLWVAGCSDGTTNVRYSKKLYWLGQDYYSKALKAKTQAERTKFLDEALSNLKRAVHQNPKNYLARNLLGYLYLNRADLELGLVEVAQCIKGPDSTESRHSADQLFHMAKEQFVAVTHIERRCTNAWLGLVSISMHFERYDEAIALSRKVIDLMVTEPVKTSCSSQGDKAVAWANMGWATFRKRKPQTALKNLKQALFLAPKLYLARYWLGRVWYNLGHYAEAVRELRRTTRRFGLPQAAFQYLGLAYLRIGRKADALVAMQQCLKLAPASCAAQECRRYVKLMTGKKSPTVEAR